MLFADQYPNPDTTEKTYFQNLMLVGLKSPLSLAHPDSIPGELKKYLSRKINLKTIGAGDVLTDEYAPVEFYASKVLNKHR